MAIREFTAQCFPEMPKNEPLPCVIPALEIHEAINKAYNDILARLKTLFADTSQARTLQQSRGRLDSVMQELYAKLGIHKESPHGETIGTFGDFRLAGDRVRRVLREALQPHREYKDRKLDPTVGKLLSDAYDEIMHRFIAKIAAYNPKPPASDIRKAARDVEAPKQHDSPKENHVHRRADPLRQLHESTLATLNAGTEIVEGVFPQPIHGFLDLDNASERARRGVMRDVPATWLPQLTEAQAGRLQLLLTEAGSSLATSFQQQLDALFLETKIRFAQDERRRALVVSDICEHSETKALILRWLEKDRGSAHGKEASTLQSPILQKHVLMQLLRPNLLRIVEEHFGRRDIPVEKRKLVDVAMGTNALPKALRHHFGKMIGYEENEALCARLRAEAPENLKIVHASLDEILANPTNHVEWADTILLAQGLHASEQQHIDHQTLMWAHTHLSHNGMVVLAFPDAEPFPASTAQMREAFGVHESGFSSAEYQQYFEERGIAVRSISPTLYIKAQTPEGKEALEEMLLPMLPRSARGNDRQWETCLKQIEDHGGILRHRLRILTAYAKEDIVPQPAIPRRIHLPFAPKTHHRHVLEPATSRTVSALPRNVALPNISAAALEPLAKPLFEMHPAEIVAFVARVNELTWGDEAAERKILEPIGVTWSAFRLLRQHIHDYEVASEVLEHIKQHGTVSVTTRIEHRQLEIILKAIRSSYANEDSFLEYLRTVGLYQRYYTKFGVPEHRRRRRKPHAPSLGSEAPLRRPTRLQPHEHAAWGLEVLASGLRREDAMLLKARQRAIEDLLGDGNVRDRTLQLRGKLIHALTR